MSISQPDSFSFGKLCQVRFIDDVDNDTDSLYINYYLVFESIPSSNRYRRYNYINFALFTPEILQSFQNDCKSIKLTHKDKKYKVQLQLQLQTSNRNESNITISRKYTSARCDDTVIVIDKLRSFRTFDHGLYTSYGTPINDRSIKAYNEWLQTKHIVKMFPDVSYKIAVFER